MDSPLFIVGAPRSGTTLLRDLLRSHPRLTFPNESHFIPPAWDIWGEVRGPEDATRLGGSLLKHPAVKRWTLPDEPILFEEDPTFAGVVSALYVAQARMAGKPRWGDKTPQYVLRLPLLGMLFKEAQFVHIIRDGRDVARSWVRHPLGAANIIEAALTWRTCVQAGRRDGPLLGAARYREIRYEVLLDDPEGTLRALLAWAGEDYSPRVLTRASCPPGRRVSSVDGREIVPADAAKWRTEMPRHDRRTFEGVAGDLLEILGYETEGEALVPGALARLGGRVQERIVWITRRLDPRLRSFLWHRFRWARAVSEAARHRPENSAPGGATSADRRPR